MVELFYSASLWPPSSVTLSLRYQNRWFAEEERVCKPIAALHVGKYFPPFAGGMELFLSDLLRALAVDGVNVGAVVHDHRRRPRRERQRLPALEARPSESSHKTGPIRIYRVPSFGRVLYAPVSPTFPLWLRAAIRAERPDILHLHLPNTSAFWALLLPEARRIPWVVHWQADVVPSDVDRRLKLGYPLYRPFEQRLLRKADKVIVTSPAYLENSRPLASWRGKCCMVPLGLDPSRMPNVSAKARKEAEEWWGTADFRILSVGRLTYYKGHEYLIKALQDIPEARALIVGEGERRLLLEKTISSLNLDERVLLTGEVSSEHLHALMETCHCVCLPSIERTEAFGIVLLEAMAHRKPAVVCDIRGSGVSWVVRNGKTGRVVPPADPGALSEALRALSSDRQVLSRMGHEGWRRYQEMFRMDRISEEVLQVYGEVLNGVRNDQQDSVS